MLIIYPIHNNLPVCLSLTLPATSNQKPVPSSCSLSFALFLRTGYWFKLYPEIGYQDMFLPVTRFFCVIKQVTPEMCNFRVQYFLSDPVGSLFSRFDDTCFRIIHSVPGFSLIVKPEVSSNSGSGQCSPKTVITLI